MSEFFRLMIIVQGVRDGLQQAVISVATTNYDETYRGIFKNPLRIWAYRPLLS